ncbi:MAG: major facilitator superfamily 1 [Rhizobacter sp.]|nr:major facilitator superfamily 1 [Rhizobacter sp.]
MNRPAPLLGIESPQRSGDLADDDRPRSKGAALTMLATAQLVIALDYSIVNVALPDIGRVLGFTDGTVQWVISAYTVTFGGFLLLGGRAADLLGRRRMFMVALGLFGMASLAGGLATDPGLLVACRAVQGAAAALLFPATLSLVTTSFAEGHERNRALAVWGSAGAGGLSFGVLAGGLLTGLFGWQAVFFVNVPITVALLALAPLVLRDEGPAPRPRRFDAPGAVLVTLGAMAIVDALVEAPTVGWGSARTLIEVAAGLVLLGLFVAVERHAPSPLVPLRLLRNRTVGGGILVTAAFMSSFGTQLFFLTLYLQQVLGESPLEAGLRFLPLVLSIVIGNQLGGRLVERLGIARTLAAGMAFGAVGLALYLRLAPTGSEGVLLAGMLLAGLGQGVAFTTMYVAVGTGVTAGEQGMASAIASSAQQIGGSVGLAALVTLLSERATALGGESSSFTGQPAGVLTVALHATFAAQAGIAVLGAVTALLVIGGGRSPERNRGGEAQQDRATQAVAPVRGPHAEGM